MKHNTHIIKVQDSIQLEKEMQLIGADKLGINMMLPKAEMYLIKLSNVTLKQANILKQEMLSKGGDAVLHKEVSMLKKEISDVILIGTKKQYYEIIKKLSIQPFGLKNIGKEIEEVLNREESTLNDITLQVGNRTLEIGKKTLVMGILNVTPDSFSDGGEYTDVSTAIKHAKEMVINGADIIDVGGESTRPGHIEVELEEELGRVIPIINELAQEVSIPISIDTYKSQVAEKAIEAGANIINDVWGFKKDPKMAEIAAKYNVPIILMHNRDNTDYKSLLDDIIFDIRESIDIALKAGVKQSNIIIDPGIGFAKTYEQNLEVMKNLDRIVALGYPVLLGTSRKSMIGNTLDLPVTDRLEGTAATVALGITKGCKIMRVHDVKEIKRVCKMMDTMIN